MWPFNKLIARRVSAAVAAARESEQRAISFASAITDAVEREAQASDTSSAIQTGLAVHEACAGLWGRAFASAEVSGRRAAAVCTPSMLELVGREFVYSGESCWLLDTEGAPFAGIASSWEVNGRGVDPQRWRYRLDVLGPSGNATRRARANGVLHFMINRTPSEPWRGQGALEHAGTSRKLAAALETRLGEEAAATVGNIITLPRDPGQRTSADGQHYDPLENLRSQIAALRGKTVLVESTAAGWGEGRAAAPRQDWQPQRLGANPPSTLGNLRDDMTILIAAACGVPPSMIQKSSDGTAQRESWRRFLHGTIAPAARIVEHELSVKLDEQVKLGFDGLFASDLSGRARAFQSMVKAGLSVDDAARLAGLMVDDAAE